MINLIFFFSYNFFHKLNSNLFKRNIYPFRNWFDVRHLTDKGGKFGSHENKREIIDTGLGLGDKRKRKGVNKVG